MTLDGVVMASDYVSTVDNVATLSGASLLMGAFEIAPSKVSPYFFSFRDNSLKSAQVKSSYQNGSTTSIASMTFSLKMLLMIMDQ